MSERTRELESRVTTEWQTASEIARSAPGTPEYTSAWRVLLRMERWGDAERKVVRTRGTPNTRTYWRLVP